MANKRRTASSEHLTLVVRKRVFGFARNVQLVSNYELGIEEVVMNTENYRDHAKAMERGRELSSQLGVELVVED